MSIEFDRGSPGKFDSRTLSRKTPSRWTGRSISGSSGDREIPLLLMSFFFFPLTETCVNGP